MLKLQRQSISFITDELTDSLFWCGPLDDAVLGNRHLKKENRQASTILFHQQKGCKRPTIQVGAYFTNDNSCREIVLKPFLHSVSDDIVSSLAPTLRTWHQRLVSRCKRYSIIKMLLEGSFVTAMPLHLIAVSNIRPLTVQISFVCVH